MDCIKEFDQADVQELINRYDIKDMSLVPAPWELILKCDNSADWEGNYGELFIKNGVLYENHCSHCSCYGCEDQWDPESVTLSAIARRPSGFEGVPIEEVTALARAKGYTGE